MAVPLIAVPEDVARTAALALATRAERGGGGTRNGVMIATALATGFVRPAELAELRRWHEQNPDTVVGEASTMLAGLYGGAPARCWHVDAHAAAAMNPAGTGAMVALAVPDDIAQALARDDGEPVDEMHVTLFHFGGDAIDLDPTIQTQLRAALSTVDLKVPSIELTHIERFSLNDDGVEPVAAVSDSPDVYALRAQLADALDGVPYSDDHAFRCHVTIGYYLPGEGPEAGPLPAPLAFAPTTVGLHWGGDVTEYPLLPAESADPADKIGADPTPATAAAGHPLRAKLAKLSKTVNATNRRTMLRLHSAATVALDEAMRQAGVKLQTRTRSRTNAQRAALAAAGERITPAVLAAFGVTEQELFDRRFDTLGAYATGILATAERRKVRAAATAVGFDPDEVEREYDDEIDQRAAAASGFLVAGLGQLARQALAGNPVTVDAGRGEFAGPVPFSVIRQTFAVASQGTIAPTVDHSGPGPSTLDDLASTLRDVGSTLVQDLLDTAEVAVQLRSTWVHGDPDRAFPPHEDLDGLSWVDTQPDELANTEDWPDTDVYEPGDHEGCTCLIETDYEPYDGDGGAVGADGETMADSLAL